MLLVFTAKDESELKDAAPEHVIADPAHSLPWDERQVVEYLTSL